MLQPFETIRIFIDTKNFEVFFEFFILTKIAFLLD